MASSCKEKPAFYESSFTAKTSIIVQVDAPPASELLQDSPLAWLSQINYTQRRAAKNSLEEKARE